MKKHLLLLLLTHCLNAHIVQKNKPQDIVALYMAHNQTGQDDVMFSEKTERERLLEKAKLGNCMAINELGMMALHIREYQEAIDWFNKALEINNDNAVYHANLAYAYGTIEDKASAKHHYQIAAEKGLTIAIVSLAEIAMSEGDYSEAIEYYKQAIEKNNKTKYKKHLALAYRLDGDYQEAIAILKKIVQEEQDDEAMHHIGLIELGLNNPEGAIHWIKKAIVVKNKPVYLYQLAYIYEKNIDDMNKALKWYKKAAAKNHLEALERLASYAFQQENYQQTVRLLKKAIKINDENDTYYTIIARAYRELGNEDLATEYYQKAYATSV